MDQTLTNALAAVKNLALPAFGFLENVSTEVFWWAGGLAAFFMLLAWLIRPSGQPGEVFSPWVSLLILAYIIALVMRDFAWATDAYIRFMSAAGIEASGGGPSHGLEDISAVVTQGWDASAALWKALNGFSIYFQPGAFLLLVVCVACVVFGHCLLAIRLIKLFGEFYILSVIAFFALPFAVWRRTLFIAEGPARYIVATGFGVMAIGFGYGLTHVLVGEIVFDASASSGYYFMKSFSMLVLLLIVAGLPMAIRSVMTGHAGSNYGGEARGMLFAASAAASAARMAMMLAPPAGAAETAAQAAASQMPSGITMNSGWQPNSSTGSGSGGIAAWLSNPSTARRFP